MARNMDSPLSLMEKLTRYLRTGTEGNFFLPGKNKAFQMFGNVFSVLIEAGQGPEAVAQIKNINAEKSYYKREPLLYFLAVGTRSSDGPTKAAAYAIVNEVCENPYDLFMWLKHVKDLSQLTKGWGSGLRKTVCDWYHSRDPMVIADFVTRYQSVGRWHHKDVFRLSHMKPQNESLGFIIKVVCKGLKNAKEEFQNPSDDVKKLIEYFDAMELVKHNKDGLAVAMAIEERKLSIEYIPAVMLTSKEVWNSLLVNMSVKDTLSSLPALARRSFLTTPVESGDQVVTEIQKKVLNKITDTAAVQQEKISPVFIYIAIRNYVRVFAKQERHESQRMAGGGHFAKRDQATCMYNDSSDHSSKKKKKKKKKKDRGDGEEAEPEKKEENNATEKATKNNPELFQSLFKCFNVAVEKNLPVTNKRYLIAVKASVSELGKGIRGSPSISALEVMSLMALFYKKKEASVDLGFFTASLTPMKFPSELEDIIQEIGQMAAPVPNLPCDPAAPVCWALEKKKQYDAFILLSDGTETHGEVSAADKLLEYREKMNLPDTRFVLCGLTAPRLDFARTGGMFDCGGFDSTVPEIISQFIMNKLDH